MNKESKIYIAGHGWLVWSAIVRKLIQEWYKNLIFKTRQELDLCNQYAVLGFFEEEKLDCVILCAAKVGGVAVHSSQSFDVLYENLQIQNNVIGAAYVHDVEKLIFIASGTIYPSDCDQPILESSLFQGELDPLHESNGLAKICGIKLCEKAKKQSNKDFFTLVPTNMYGIGDSFEEWKSRVIGSLIARFYQAKLDNLTEVVVWWSGNALREFLYVDDMADAVAFFMTHTISESYINIGTDQEVSIKEIAKMIKEVVWYQGNIIFDTSKSEWRPRRKLDTMLASSYGWTAYTSLEEWLKKTYQYFLSKL
jgi:GDP-L-fucose synthase